MMNLLFIEKLMILLIMNFGFKIFEKRELTYNEDYK